MKEYRKKQQEIYDRAINDAKKRGCYYIQWNAYYLHRYWLTIKAAKLCKV